MALGTGKECVPSVQSKPGFLVIEQNLIPGLRRVTAGAPVAPHEFLEAPLVVIGMTGDALERPK